MLCSTPEAAATPGTRLIRSTVSSVIPGPPVVPEPAVVTAKSARTASSPCRPPCRSSVAPPDIWTVTNATISTIGVIAAPSRRELACAAAAAR